MAEQQIQSTERLQSKAPPSLSISTAPIPEERATEKKASARVSKKNKVDAILNTGLNLHAKHLHDFVLDAATNSPRRNFQFFASQIRSLVKGIEAGVVTGFNEKFDGSPAIVFGLDAKRKPFVAYKGGFNRKGKGGTGQVLFGNSQEIEAKVPRYQEGSTIHATYADLCEALLPKIEAIQGNLTTGYVFQADVMFTEGNGGRQFIDGAWHLKPNTIRYIIGPDDPNFKAIGDAKVGLFVHTPCVRRLDKPYKRLSALSSQNETVVRRIVEEIHSGEVFAAHPWHDEVAISGKYDLSGVETDIATARIALKSLSPEFKRLFGARHLDHFKVFFNSRLYANGDGGVFSQALRNETPTGEVLASEMIAWQEYRTQKALEAKSTSKERRSSLPVYTKALREVWKEHESEVLALVQAYQAGIRAQDRVQQVILPAVSSKLGAGEVEGGAIRGMLSSKKVGEARKPYAVKLVDRLDFTMRNNENNQRSRSTGFDAGEDTQRSFDRFERSLSVWRPGTHFFVGKMQFPHAGHIAMIRDLATEVGPENIIVLASDKQYDPCQLEGSKIGLSKSREDFQAGNFSHPFSCGLREEILRLSLPAEIDVSVMEVAKLWSYLETARELEKVGKINLVVGDKEVGEVNRYRDQEERYSDFLRLVPVPLKQEGVSGTELRQAVVRHLEGDANAIDTINQGLFFVPESERPRIVTALSEEYAEALRVFERTCGRW